MSTSYEPDRSHVAIEAHRCPVCGKDHETGSILLHKRMAPKLRRIEVTAVSMCPEHQDLFDRGYVALVAIDPAKSGGRGGRMRPEEAYRTGRLAHIKREAFPMIFDTAAPEHDGEPLPMIYVEDGVIDMLTRLHGGPQPEPLPN